MGYRPGPVGGVPLGQWRGEESHDEPAHHLPRDPHDGPVPELGPAPTQGGGVFDAGEEPLACVDEEVLAATEAAVEAVAAQLVNLNVRLPTSATEQEAIAFPPGQSLVDRDDPVPELGLAPAVRIGISATQYGGVHESGVVTPRDDGVQGTLTTSRPEQAIAAGDSQSGEATRAEEVEARSALTASRLEGGEVA